MIRASASAGREPRGWFRHVPAPVRHALRLVVVGLVVEYLLLPQIAGSRAALHLLLDVDNVWLGTALAFEAASLLAYAALTRAVLQPFPHRPRYLTLLRIDLATLAASHVLPAGSAIGMGLGYRLLTRAGLPGSAAAFGKAMQAVGSAVVLNLLLWIAMVASIPLHGLNAVYGPIALVGLLLLTAVAALLLLLVFGQARVAALLIAVLRRVPRVSEDRARALVAELALRLDELLAQRHLLGLAAAWAVANWLFDAAALWTCVRAFGHTLGPAGVLVPYGIAMVGAALPITPGGLGIVEGLLVPMLVAFGTPRGVAILGVLAWRFLQFVLPIPVGGACYLSLGRLGPPAGDPRVVGATGR